MSADAVPPAKDQSAAEGSPEEIDLQALDEVAGGDQVSGVVGYGVGTIPDVQVTGSIGEVPFS